RTGRRAGPGPARCASGRRGGACRGGSACPAGRPDGASAELLRELDPVPVRVEDVEEADLSLQLDDDPDLDARLAQPVGLPLQVVDVDVRDAAVLSRLPLGEADLHPATPQARPALVEVERELLEAERLAVEATPLVEVADVVPDGRRHLVS